MKACTAAEMREIDRRAADEFGLPTLLLMENAGRAVAAAARRWLPRRGGRGLVVAGRGNNGGDGLVAARHLANAGHTVQIWLLAEPDALRGEVRLNFEIVQRMGLAVSTTPPDRLNADVIVDALYGTGLQGDVRPEAAAAIERMNAADAPVVAVDLPSGLESDTGRWRTACVQATVTVTLGLPKIGLLLWPGRERVGELCVDDIGLPPALREDPALLHEWLDPPTVAAWLPRRAPTAHKGDAGRVLLLAGSAGMSGAAALAALGALRGGAGLVTVAVPRSLQDVMASKLTEAMTVGLPETPGRALAATALTALPPSAREVDVLAIGPGLGRDPETGTLVRTLLREWTRPLVVDADALNLVAPAGPGSFPPEAVVTPHPGELARLLGTDVATVESNRVDAARRASREFRCVVVLKGAASLIAAPDGRLAINSTGTPAMATGGVGDVLTGLVAALLGQGLPPFEAAAAAVYLHGLAGELAAADVGGIGMLASDLAERLPRAMAATRERGE